MARLVFGLNQSLDGYVDHTAFAPGPGRCSAWWLTIGLAKMSSDWPTLLRDLALIRVAVCVAAAAMLSGCGSSPAPTSPTSPVVCSAVITIGIFSNGAPASPGQGMVWTSYFQATVLPAQASVYVVDINSAAAGCLTTWTAVSADTSAVQLSPASGTGRSQVELFMPANTGAQRSTLVTIAGQTGTITQGGR